MTASSAVVTSMTGFARVVGETEIARWAWDLKSVNGKGFDLRLRVPNGFEAIEGSARLRFAARFKRGSLQASLTLQRDAPPPVVRVNRAALERLVESLAELSGRAGLRPASLDGLLAVRGIVEVVDAAEDEEASRALAEAMLGSLDEAIETLAAMRCREGAALHAILDAQLQCMDELVRRAEAVPGRQPEAIRQRLAQRVAELSGTLPALDPVRLHQEAILLAAKADIREELDRLALHIRACTALLREGGPVGRKLDFLAQELSREASTLCAKSNDGALTLIGLELRSVIDQMREQIQNLE